MRRLIFCLALLMVISTTPMAMADNDRHDHSFRIRTHLSGFNEVHFAAGGGTPTTLPALRGAVSTKASGKFVAKFNKHSDPPTIHYELSYKDLEGVVTQAHIHFGQRHTVGGIVVWLCQTEGTPAPPAVADLTPFCPVEGTVEGTITPDQVLPLAAQGIEAGNFDELVDAILAGVTYANVHSGPKVMPASPGFSQGEIRGQIPGSHDD